MSPARRALLKDERYKEAKELEDKRKSLFRQITWGEIQYMMYRVTHQSCKLFLEGFTNWRDVFHLGRNSSLGRAFGKGRFASESR